jgi:hypothetical protein
MSQVFALTLDFEPGLGWNTVSGSTQVGGGKHEIKRIVIVLVEGDEGSRIGYATCGQLFATFAIQAAIVADEWICSR